MFLGLAGKLANIGGSLCVSRDVSIIQYKGRGACEFALREQGCFFLTEHFSNLEFVRSA